MIRARAAGFTLIELVVAMTILGGMMLLLYLRPVFASQLGRGRRVGRASADRRIGEHFVRREMGELFPMRWKGRHPAALRLRGHAAVAALRVVAPRRARDGRAVARRPRGGGATRAAASAASVMRRAMPDDNADSFGPPATRPSPRS
jgi:prepilin-type N-terminal cleavage/methylation domain-containing protein